MGVYVRKESRFYWLHLERPGQRAIKESSKIPIDAPTAFLRKEQRQQADEAYIARMRELAANRYELVDQARPEPEKLSVVLTWYKTQYSAHKRGAEREAYAIAALDRALGHLLVTDITTATAQEYITHRKADGLSPNGINREVDLLKAVLKAAAAKGYLRSSPLSGMKKLRVVKKRKKVLTQAEEDAILAELQPRDRALYIVAVDTLLRLSNVLNLRWDEVSRTHITLMDSKTGPYQVPLSARARAALESLPQKGPYVFPERRQAKTERDRRMAVRMMLKRACERANVKFGREAGGVTFHTATRATGATRMLRKGADPSTVQAVGNWRDFRSMQEYLQTDDRLMRQAVDTIGSESRFASGTAAIQPKAKRDAKARKQRKKR